MMYNYCITETAFIKGHNGMHGVMYYVFCIWFEFVMNLLAIQSLHKIVNPSVFFIFCVLLNILSDFCFTSVINP